MRYLLFWIAIVGLTALACVAERVVDAVPPVMQQPAADSGNKTPVTRETAMPEMPRGKADPDWEVDIYRSELACQGTTLFADNHDIQQPRIVEINMLGEIVWQYKVPAGLQRYTNPGFHTEQLPTGNILFVLPTNGVYEIDRSGQVVWSYNTRRISHAAHRLPDGNTIFVCGADDQKDEPQVTVVNQQGKIVWTWYAREAFDMAPYNTIYDQGWTHINGVTWLQNGNILASLRNLNLVAEINAEGRLLRKIGEGIYVAQHDPVLLSNGNMLAANHCVPQKAIEIVPATGEVVWEYAIPRELLRDADRLPNGNTIITGASQIVEVTPDKKIAWRFRLKTPLDKGQSAGMGFYKCQRIVETR